MDLMQSMSISAGGMYAQSQRMKVAAENIANQDSVQDASGTGPYRAKLVTFRSVLERKSGLTGVEVKKISPDMATPLKSVYQPGSPLADSRGFVKMPNVDPTVENLNMREAQRSYEANMAALTTAREMATRTLDLLR